MLQSPLTLLPFGPAMPGLPLGPGGPCQKKNKKKNSVDIEAKLVRT